MTKGQSKADEKFIDYHVGPTLRLKRLTETGTLLRTSWMVREPGCSREDR